MSEPNDNQGERFTPDEVIAKQRNKQLFVLSGVIIVLAGIVYLTLQFRDVEPPLQDVLLAGGQADAPSFEKDEVNQIEIWKGASGTKVTLERRGNEWRVPSRFNAPADKSDIDALLTRTLESRRLNRANTKTEAQFGHYRLDEKNAAHLRFTNDAGEELLHVMVGRSETGGRDFVRLAGENAPAGIFELAGQGGNFNTLYSTLNLDSNGEPNARRWISTKGFKPLPLDAVVQSITIKDGESRLTFDRKPGADETQEQWELTSPQKASASGEEVRGMIDALMNYNAGDIAGLVEDHAKYDVIKSGREVVLTYRTSGTNLNTVRLYFGKKNDDNEVAVMQKENDKGDYIYWAGDFILNRLFRPKSDFLQKDRVKPMPDGAEVQHITVVDEGTMLELQREKQGAAVSWKIIQPWQGEADRLEVNNLLTGLNTLQGYSSQAESDYDILGVAPGAAAKAITLQYTVSLPNEDSDGQDRDDPREVQPEQPEPAPEPSKLKTATLYFGKTEGGEVPMLRVSGDVKELYWVAEGMLKRLFQRPINYVKAQPVNLVPEGWALQEVRRVNEGEVTQIIQKAVAENGGKRWMLNEPEEEMANQGEALALVNALKNMTAVEQPALDGEEFELGEGVSTRTVDLRLTKAEESQIISLYFGKPKWERATLMVSANGVERYFLLSQTEAEALFDRVLHEYDVKVGHILISWEGLGVPLKEAGRTKTEAHELAKQLLQRYREGEDFTELQQKYNEDSSNPTAVFDVSPQAGLVEPFKRLSARLEVDEAGIVESQFGYHVIKRIE